MPKREKVRVNISVTKADWDAAKTLESEFTPTATRQGIATVAFSMGLKQMRKDLKG